LQIPGSFVGHRYLQTFRRNHLCLSDMLMHADVCMFNKRLYLLYFTVQRYNNNNVAVHYSTINTVFY